MTSQHIMSKRLFAIAFAALIAAALGSFTATQSAYADLTQGSASSDALAVQDDSNDDSSSTKASAIDKSTNIYRMYNPNSGEHFYTGSFDEAMHLLSVGWNYEKVGWVSERKDDGVALYRLYNPYAGDHHYTTNEEEKDNLVKVGWNDEGIAFYSAKEDAENAKEVYREYNPNATTGAHNFTMSEDEHNGLVEKGWKDEEIAWYAFKYDSKSDSLENSTPLYRMYNPYSGEHFYTCSKDEVATLVKAGWSFEKATWTTLAKEDTGAKAVYRTYNKNNGDHHYTMDVEEKDKLVKAGWNDEGIVFYSADKGSDNTDLIEIYRVYNPNAQAGSHFFTPSKTERDALVELGWTDEKVAWKAKSAE